MINFPIFNRLDITDFGLYPGVEGGEPGLHVEFNKGLTLILGANGLGKTTLVTIIYRILTGPYDIPGLADRAGLGNLRLVPKLLPRGDRSIFAKRVLDGGSDSRASLTVQFGLHQVLIERSLHDLSLTTFAVDGEVLENNEVEVYQRRIQEMAGVSSFGDWVLLLRHLVFYFEDRRALVWDPSAQSQILRILFLSNEIARKWTADQREILEVDSRMRNLNAALGREERALSQGEAMTETGAASLQQLKTLEQLQQVDSDKLEQLQSDFVAVAATRQTERANLLNAEQNLEYSYRAVEHAKLVSISARFPNMTETLAYILSQLMSEDECLVCGHHAPEAAQLYSKRLNSAQCIVCQSDLTAYSKESAESELIMQQLMSELQHNEQGYKASQKAYQEAEKDYQTYVKETTILDAAIQNRSSEIDKLVRKLPPQEDSLHKQRSELATMRSRVAELREFLTVKRKIFTSFIEESQRGIASRASRVKPVFDSYAQGFLFEECRLIWSPQKLRVGETGEGVEFPAFELEMTGANFSSPVRRTGPEQVSESQREFIDLAFRMALMEVAGYDSVSSLIIDAPESSLDAVFVSRAANVLSRFAETGKGNRLLITSNLVEGELIPNLIQHALKEGDAGVRVVDLFKLAEPTAAVRVLGSEYNQVRDKLLQGLASYEAGE